MQFRNITINARSIKFGPCNKEKCCSVFTPIVYKKFSLYKDFLADLCRDYDQISQFANFIFSLIFIYQYLKMASKHCKEDDAFGNATIRELMPGVPNSPPLKMRLMWKGKSSRPSRIDSLVDYYRRFKFMDENRDEIFAVAYGRQICNDLGECLKIRRVYKISNYKVEGSSRRYSSIATEVSLVFSPDIEIVWMKNALAFPQKMLYNFVKFDRLDALQNDDVVDLVGVVLGMGEYKKCLDSVPPYRKLDLILCDDTSRRQKVTLWGKHAKKYNDKQLDNEKLTILTMKGVKAKIFNRVNYTNRNFSFIEITFNLNEEAEMRFNQKLEE
uniref:Replication protein A OB domain-containing protein n=1 Tax=Romanomermis culicivorax TaxID=13658 RepID=A0A915HLF8_ROMCU